LLEENVLLCDEGRERFAVCQLGWEIGFVVTDPAEAFWHHCCVESLDKELSSSRRSKIESCMLGEADTDRA